MRIYRRGTRTTVVALIAATLASANAFAEGTDRRWYGSLTALYDMPSDSGTQLDLRVGTIDGDILLSDELAFALALGLRTQIGLRVELEVASRSSDIDGASGVRLDGVPVPGVVSLSGGLKTWTLMANLLSAFGDGSYRPYIGAGVGFARHDGDATLAFPPQSGGTSGTESGDDTVVAYQVMAGIEGDVGENMTVFAGLRHLGSGDLEIETLTADYKTTSIDVGVRLEF